MRPTGDFMNHSDYFNKRLWTLGGKYYDMPENEDAADSDEVHVILAAGDPDMPKRPMPVMLATVRVAALVIHVDACAPLNACCSCHQDKASGADVCMPDHATSNTYAIAHDGQCAPPNM